jgi:hypothetical protein
MKNARKLISVAIQKFPQYKDRDYYKLRQLYGSRVIDTYYKCEIYKKLLGVRENPFKRYIPKDLCFATSRPILANTPRIAIHYCEGIEEHKRHDTFWIKDIPPENLMVYIDTLKVNKNPVSGEVLKELDKKGIMWVALKKDVVRGDFDWKKANVSYSSNPFEKEYNYWTRFYQIFNIKAVFDFVKWTGPSIAQYAVLDRLGAKRIGMQRSTITSPYYMPWMQYGAFHKMFTWGTEYELYRNRSPLINEFKPAGFPFYHQTKTDCFFTPFKVALFDNGISGFSPFTIEHLTDFYNSFLDWALKHEAVMLVIKEKYKGLLSRVKEAEKKIMKLGRRVIRVSELGGISNIRETLPSKAFLGTDLAVGLGISSAVTEAAIHGVKAVHCDLVDFYEHPYYNWGYNRIIFDDITALINAIDKYGKEGGKLGDWGKYIDTLDPYRDYDCGKRVGEYMKGLI